MATGTSGDRAVRLLLSLVIAAMAVALVYVIVTPAQRAAEAQALTNLSRQRMSDVRNALGAWRTVHDSYPATLDSVAIFARTDSAFQAQLTTDEGRTSEFNPDSMLVSPRSGERFEYAVVSDTTGLEIFWLNNPDIPGDSIGARIASPAYRNAASWE